MIEVPFPDAGKSMFLTGHSHDAVSRDRFRETHLSRLIRAAANGGSTCAFGLKLQAGFRIGGNAPLSFSSIDTAY